MSKLYGERWKVIASDLGQGGQSDLFRVVDIRREYQGEFALKRVRNPTRHERFRNEIEAIKRLTHPNIIRLIDHSALDDIGSAPQRQFLVMPIAKGGDLGKSRWSGLYKDMIDGALQVAKQLASALAAAHSAGVIHRDVKPANILFTENAHEVWLSDFGICLLRETERTTETGEVVGPRAFMAPELEDGGKLDVSPAADIYSLGKVIYYMVSGGVTLPREQLREERYRHVFAKGERFRLLEILLAKMVCPLSERANSMEYVTEELARIEAWERNAQFLPMSKSGLSDLDRLRQQASKSRQIANQNAEARDHEARKLDSVRESFLGWLAGELKKAAQHIGGADLKCEVRDPTTREGVTAAVNSHLVYNSIAGLELALRLDPGPDGSAKIHRLQVYLCERATVGVQVGQNMRESAPRAAQDPQLAFLPYYRQTLEHEHPFLSPLMGFMTRKQNIGATSYSWSGGYIGSGQLRMSRIEPVSGSFHSGATQLVEFRASEWPATAEKLREALTEAIDTFIAFVSAGATAAGP